MIGGCCPNCGTEYLWRWEEAFDKYGFGDGNGVIHTPDVVAVLREAGYEVKHEIWGAHNDVIDSIKKDGLELMPDDDSEYDVGKTDPREYLPKDIIALLDKNLEEDEEE